jgi:hypothetical protein
MHSVLLDGRAATCQTAARGLRGRTLHYAGAERQLRVESADTAALEQHMPVASQAEQQRVIRAPMAGTLVEVKVAKGDKVGEAAGSWGLQKAAGASAACLCGLLARPPPGPRPIPTWPAPCAPALTPAHPPARRWSWATRWQ